MIKAAPGSADVPVGQCSSRRLGAPPTSSPNLPQSRRDKEGGTAVSAVKDRQPRIHANPRE
ncbi:MAG: hypothetical protein ACKOLA_13690 [Spartobacteria bacterium]